MPLDFWRLSFQKASKFLSNYILILDISKIHEKLKISCVFVLSSIENFMKDKTEKELLELVREFENGTISREKWKHAEHLIVAFYYIKNSNSLAEATDKMRRGIFNLLKSFGVDLEKEMPYHETMTVFWMNAVNDLAEKQIGYSISETANSIVETLRDKDLPLKFYSRDRLFSKQARKQFVPPDLEEFTK